MCNDIYNRFQQCRCKVFQNTCECGTARRGQPLKEGCELEKTVLLPAPRSKAPPGLLCKRTVSIRPIEGSCPDCQMKMKRKAQEEKQAASTKRDETLPAGSGSGYPSTMSGRHTPSLEPISSVVVAANIAAVQRDTPSPDATALARVRDSFIKVTEEHRSTPPSQRR
ncbi:hypothetical protein DL770_004725 [Monosporascus sp. CRB-9-2]|nr:hypothetical protein DL770_004725 [Monosporascus sp. CRB-9-2]